MQSEPRS